AVRTTYPSFLKTRSSTAREAGSSSITTTVHACQGTVGVSADDLGGAVGSPIGGDRVPEPVSGRLGMTIVGRCAVNVVPTPSVLCTSMSPPISLQSLWLITNPSPVPSCLRVLEVSAWKKVSRNRRQTSSGFMPTPVSDRGKK